MAKNNLDDQNRMRIAYDRQLKGNLIYSNYVGRIAAADVSKCIFYSSKIGDDSTGDGTFANPYATYSKGTTDVSTTKKYVLDLDEIYIESDPTKKIFLDLLNGLDTNDGLTEGAPKLTYASAKTALDAAVRNVIEIIDGTTIALTATNDDIRPMQVRIGKEIELTGWDYAISQGAPNNWKYGVTIPATPTASFISHIGTYNGNHLIGEGFKNTSPAPFLTMFYSEDNGKTWYESDSVIPADSTFIGQIIKTVNGVVFALGSHGAIGKSFDGKTWEFDFLYPAPGNNPTRDVIYFNSLYFICGFTAALDPILQKSSDGIIFTDISSSVANSLRAFIEYQGLLFVVGEKVYSSVDGISFTLRHTQPASQVLSAVAKNDGETVIVATATDGIYSSSDGFTWTQRDTTINMVGVIYAAGIFVAWDISSGILKTSSDGITWTTRTVHLTQVISVVYGNGYFVADGVYSASQNISYSTDGITWTLANSDGAWTGTIYNNRRFIRTAFSAGYKIQYADFIKSDFSNFFCDTESYSGLGSLNTLKQFSMSDGNGAPIQADEMDALNCRFESAMSYYALEILSGNLDLKKCLLSSPGGSIKFNKTDLNAVNKQFNIESSTLIGKALIDTENLSGVNALLKDVILVGDFIANAGESVSIDSGSFFGTLKNTKLNARVLTVYPEFVDTTDYKLKRKVEGEAINAALINLAYYAKNPSGSRTDIGAYITDELLLAYVFTRVKDILKGVISHGKQLESSEQIGDTGEPDVYVNTDRMLEVLTSEIPTVTDYDTAFIDELDKMDDKQVNLTVDYETEQSSTVTVNGAHSIGDIVLNIVAAAFEIGQSVTIDGEKYLPLYVLPDPTSATKLILDKPLKTAVPDTTVLNLSSPLGSGIYVYSPITGRNNQRLIKVNGEYKSGVALRFIREYPG